MGIPLQLRFFLEYFFFSVLTPPHFGTNIARHLALDIVVKRYDFVVLVVQCVICQPREFEAVKTKVALETLLRILDPLYLLYCLLMFFGWTSTERGEVEDEKYIVLEYWELKRKFGPKWE